MLEFKAFPKLARWSRDAVITEKLDGTNAAVIITDDGQVGAQSRTRLITPEDDNYGFAKYVQANADYFKSTLGEGHHYGEWWGQGIQRNYGLNQKRFSLFNVHRWAELAKDEDAFKRGVGVVPLLWKGSMNAAHIMLEIKMQELEKSGSKAAPGFMKPEGVVIFHEASQYLFKKTFEKDEAGKGQ